MREPLAGHGGAIAHPVKALRSQSRPPAPVEDDDRHFGALHHRQHGGGKRIRRDVQENQIHVGAAELVAGLQRLFGLSIRPRLTTSTPGRSSFAPPAPRNPGGAP